MERNWVFLFFKLSRSPFFIDLFLLKVSWIWEISKIKDYYLKPVFIRDWFVVIPFICTVLALLAHEMMTFVHVDCSVYLTPIDLPICGVLVHRCCPCRREDWRLPPHRQPPYFCELHIFDFVFLFIDSLYRGFLWLFVSHYLIRF
jgi:hypothetical protein